MNKNRLRTNHRELVNIGDDTHDAVESDIDALEAADVLNLKIAANLSDLDDAGTARTNLGVAIGSDVQAWDDDLDDIAGLTPTLGAIMIGDGTDWIADTTVMEFSRRYALLVA